MDFGCRFDLHDMLCSDSHLSTSLMITSRQKKKMRSGRTIIEQSFVRAVRNRILHKSFTAFQRLLKWFRHSVLCDFCIRHERVELSTDIHSHDRHNRKSNRKNADDPWHLQDLNCSCCTVRLDRSTSGIIHYQQDCSRNVKFNWKNAEVMTPARSWLQLLPSSIRSVHIGLHHQDTSYDNKI